MQVTDALIDKLSRLAMLKFDAAERDTIKSDLEEMIRFIDKLKEVDTTNIEPLLHMSSNNNILREDAVCAMLSREEVLQNASLHDTQFFKVPKVIKKPE